jgi:hypothetical protein
VLINTDNMPDVGNYLYQPYEGVVSQYPRHVLGQDSIDELVERDEYRMFKKAVTARMQRDGELHAFLMNEGGPAFRAETAEERQEREEAEARYQAELREKAKDVPVLMARALKKLVTSLPEREEGHDKGPYLSPNAEQLNGWLGRALSDLVEAGELAPEVKQGGPNLVVAVFMDEVERAREASKIRNRDYRRLMGHAMSAAAMDEAMVKSLVARFAESKHFRREITEESEYYLKSYEKKQRDETVHMAANFKLLMKALPEDVRAEIKAANKKEKKKKERKEERQQQG